MSKPRSISGYVPIYTAYGQLAGEMVRLLLESMNIPAIVSQESAGITYGLTVGPLGEVQILVPADKVDEARQVLKDMEDGKYAETFYPGQLPTYPVYKNNKMSQEENLKEMGSDWL